MTILYSNAQELLSQVDSNGCHLKKWASDMSEIIDTTDQEKSTELDAIHLATKNAHGIPLWKVSGGAVVQRTQGEIDADEAAYVISQFNSKIFFGRLIQEFDASRWFALSKLGVGWTMQQLVDYPNFAGLKAYANGLLADSTILEADALIINACLLEQGINLDNF